jgi:Pvc16 N-terminal domain
LGIHFYARFHERKVVLKGPSMSDFSVVQAVSGELRRQIVTVLDSTPDSDFGIDGNIDRIVLESPATTMPDNTVASLFLHHLEIDGHLRNQRMLPDRAESDLFRKPPLPLRLRFLFTPMGEEEETNLLLLGRVIQHFHDSPVFDTVLGTPVGNSHGGAPARLKVRIETPPLGELTNLWSAFSTPLRLSVTLAVEIVAVESGRAPVQMPRAAELIAGYGQKPRGNGT